MITFDGKYLSPRDCVIINVVCDQFWLDIRCEGVTPEQRNAVHPDLKAAGYVVFRVKGEASVTCNWRGFFHTERSTVELCSENPGLELSGPVVILDIHQSDEFAERVLKRHDVQGAIREAIMSRLSSIPEVVSEALSQPISPLN